MQILLNKKIYGRFFKVFGLGLCVMLNVYVNSAVAARPTIQSIRIMGNRVFSGEMIQNTLQLEKGGLLPADWSESAFEALTERYHADGYLLFRVDSLATVFSEDSQTVDIHLTLFEGPQVRVGRLVVHGFNPDTLDYLPLKSGDVFIEAKLDQLIASILDVHERTGYPLAEVLIDSLILHEEPESSLIDVALRVEKKSEIIVARADVRGNEITRTGVILRESRLQLGQPFDKRELETAAGNLRRLRFLKSVSEPVVQFHQSQATVIFPVKEGNTNTFDGVIGYTPAKKEGQRGYVTGRMEFAFENLFGTGRLVNAFWEKKDAHSQAVRLEYMEPWVMGYPFNTGGLFSQEIRDTTYVEREWRIRMNYVPLATLTLGLEGGQKSILPDSLGSALFNIQQSRTWFISGRIDYTTFDNLLNPRKGVRYHTEFSIGTKKNLGPAYLKESPDWKSSVYTRRVHIDAETALPLWKRQVLFISAHGSEVKTGDKYIPISEQIRFGGANTLRGYAEDFFRGSLVSWLNLEYRYLLGPQSRAHLFVDSGIYQRKEKEAGWIRESRIGFGFGLRIDTRLGVMGIDYGLGQGDNPMQGKVHVGLVNRF